MKKKIKTGFVGFISALLFLLVIISCVTGPNLSGVTTYYVRADGDDSSKGITEDAPFKTLTKAVQVASQSKLKKITIIGKIPKSTTVDNSGKEEILVTGKYDNLPDNNAVLSTDKGSVIEITGLSNIRFDNITLTDATFGGALFVDKGAYVTLGNNAIITGNSDNGARGSGAGAYVNGTLVMEKNSKIENNSSGFVGGGITIQGGTVIMKDNATISGNSSAGRNEIAGGGGVCIGESGSLTMQDNAIISNNKAVNGGGIFVYKGKLVMKNNASISNNNSTGDSLLYGGGGVFARAANFSIQDDAKIFGNTANYGGGVYLKFTEIEQTGGSISNNTAKVNADIYINDN
jgi:hypothetical protein